MTVVDSLILTLATHRHFDSIVMKTLRRILPSLLLAASFVVQSDAADQKIATFDMRKAYSEYWKTKKTVEALRQQRLNKEQEVKEMVTERGKKITEHQKMLKQFQDPGLREAERERFKRIMERKVVEIREIEQAIQQFERATNTEMTNAQQKMVKTIIEEIRGLVSAKAKERGYTFVLDASAVSPTQLVVVYNTGQDDLTKEIQEQLEATNPEKAVKKPDKPKPTPKKD